MRNLLISTDALQAVQAEFIDGQVTEKDEFYKTVNNCIYKSLVEFLGILHAYNQPPVVPTISVETPHLETWRFFDRFYHEPQVSLIDDSIEAMSIYRQLFGGHEAGIASEWKPRLIIKLRERSRLTDKGVMILSDLIFDVWCPRLGPGPGTSELGKIEQEVELMHSQNENRTEAVPIQAATEPACICADEGTRIDDCKACSRDCGECEREICVHIGGTPGTPGSPTCKGKDCEICHEKCWFSDEDESDDGSEDEDDDTNYLQVLVCGNDEGSPYADIGMSVIAIVDQSDRTLTMYETLSEIDLSQYESDPVNSHWDWLKHFLPNAVLKSADPNLWLDFNDYLEEIKLIKLGTEGEESLIGVYYIDPELAEEEFNGQLIKQIDTLCRYYVHDSPFSHLPATMELYKDMLLSPEAEADLLQSLERLCVAIRQGKNSGDNNSEYDGESEESEETEEEPEEAFAYDGVSDEESQLSQQTEDDFAALAASVAEEAISSGTEQIDPRLLDQETELDLNIMKPIRKPNKR
jgi:hypothetical protein